MKTSAIGLSGCFVDGGAYAKIRPAATKVAGHGIVDIFIAGIGFVVQQRNGGHNLSALAITALGNLFVNPGLLNRVQFSILSDSLDGGNLFANGSRDGGAAGSDGRSIEVNGAGAALGDAAAEFGSIQSEVIADNPKQGGIFRCLDCVGFAVDGEFQ